MNLDTHTHISTHTYMSIRDVQEYVYAFLTH